MVYLKLLVENRLDTVKLKYPGLSDEEINEIFEMDPSDSKKYVLWIAREWKGISNKSVVRETLLAWEKTVIRLTSELITDYHIHYPELGKIKPLNTNNFKDIYTYNFDEVTRLNNYITKIPTNKEAKDIARSETIKIFEGPLDGYNMLIVQPLSYASSCHYGQTTKWCTASKTTKRNFEHETLKGDLFYIIMKGDQSHFKYAIHFVADDDQPTVFNADDSKINTNEFFTRFPGIKNIFADRIVLTPYDILLNLDKENDATKEKQLLNGLITQCGDVAVMVVNDPQLLANMQIKLYLDKGFINNTFVGNEYLINAVNGNVNYEMAGYESETEFNEGQIFKDFTNVMWNELAEYFKWKNYPAYKLILNRKNNNIGNQIAKILNEDDNEDIKDVIIRRYAEAMSDSINEGGSNDLLQSLSNHIQSFFESICEYSVQMVKHNVIIVSIYDVIRWYQDGEYILPEESERKTLRISQIISKLATTDAIYDDIDFYEFYGITNRDDEMFKNIFDNLGYDLQNKVNQWMEDFDDETIENMEFIRSEIKKLERADIEIGEIYETPDGLNKIQIHQPDNESGRFEITIQNIKTNKMKSGLVTADRIINLLNIPSAFDIIDETKAKLKQMIK